MVDLPRYSLSQTSAIQIFTSLICHSSQRNITNLSIRTMVKNYSNRDSCSSNLGLANHLCILEEFSKTMQLLMLLSLTGLLTRRPVPKENHLPVIIKQFHSHRAVSPIQSRIGIARPET